MRGSTPTVHCDARDGFCGNWEVDHYETFAYSVNGVRVTSTQRAPGWRNDDLYDFCPEHVAEQKAI